MDSLGSNLELNRTLEGMRQILRLSYVNIPHYLKACMLYLGIYPEDHIIKKRDLAKQWAAQGFIGKASGQNREDVAERYFNELVNRSIIQPVKTGVDDDVLSCRVHDMMLDLIIHECGEENFVTIIDDQKGITQVHNKTLQMGYVSAFPRWISKLHYLGRLKLWIKQVVGDDMLILAQLPCLLSLDLFLLKMPEEVVVISRTGFSRLKHLEFRSHRLAFDAGAMPALQKLEVRCNAHGWAMHVAAPAGIEHLKALREVYVHIGAEGAKESNTRAAESVFRNAIDLHPGRPAANIQCKLGSLHYFDFDVWPPLVDEEDEEEEPREDEEDEEEEPREDEEEEPTQHPRDLDEL